MFEQWYQQDGRKIMATKNNINAIKEEVMTFLSKLCESEDELYATEVVEYFCLQSTGTFKYWYDTPGILHQQLQQGLQGRYWFRPPIYFET